MVIRPSTYYYLLSFFFAFTIHFSQAQNSTPKLTDHTTIYLDSLLVPCDISSASYYGFIPIKNYYLRTEALSNKNRSLKIVYTPYSDTILETQIRPLHGEIFIYSNQERGDKFDQFFAFTFGKLAVLKQPSSKKGTQQESLYLDSARNNDAGTFIRYVSEGNTPIYKQYLNKNGNTSFAQKIFIGEHKTFTSKYKPVFGLYWNLGPDEDMKRNSRTFVELGISKKFLKGTYVRSVKKTYYDNLHSFQAINLSLLGTSRGNEVYLGLKASYSYTYLFFKGEAGVVNYSDLSAMDTRLLGGLGFTFLGTFSGMFYYTLPLTKNEFTDLGRIAIGFTFH